MPRLVLASASPRRRELLAALGVAFEVRPVRTDETLPPDTALDAALQAVALRKARAVRADGRAVLAADTAVAVDGQVFGKPAGRADAQAMLSALSGRTHRVVTGVALCTPAGHRTLAVETRVRFRDLTPAEIGWYASTDEPYDKAGAYAIQGRGAFLVAGITGSYTNVVGLPMSETVDLLAGEGLVPWGEEAERDG